MISGFYIVNQLSNAPIEYVIPTNGLIIQGKASFRVWRDLNENGVCDENEVKFEYETSNIVVTIGARHVRNALGWANATNSGNCTAIAFGNHTSPAIGDTQLDDEANEVGIVREYGTVANYNTTTYDVYVNLTATGDIQVNAMSLHWDDTAASNNNCFALANITTATLEDQDNLDGQWTVRVVEG